MSRTHPARSAGLIRTRLRRLVYEARTEGGGPVQETAAIGLGVFIGCLPLYGLHLLLCVGVGTLLRLNRLKLYLAANISNPLVAPVLLFAELQVGSWLHRGRFHDMSFQAVRAAGWVELGTDLVIGSLVVGGGLAAVAAWGTYAMVRVGADDARFLDLVRRASDRYVGTSITAWEFARGKLRHDPIYRAAAFGGLLTGDRDRAGGTLVDVGCGQGLMLALLAEARDHSHDVPAPVFQRMVGIELRPNVAAIATTALGPDAEVITRDAGDGAVPQADVVLLFDVLHLMEAGAQDRLLAAIVAALAPGGVLLVREADAAAGWPFTAVRLGNRIKALAVGRWRQRFQFRSAAEWAECLGRHGLYAHVQPMGGGTPFGNVLLRATVVVPAASGPTLRI